MKFSSISTMRPSASALILAGTMLLGVHGIANAQSGNSGQAKENPSDYSDKKDPIEGHTGEYKGSSSDKNKAGSSQRGQKDKSYNIPQGKEDTEMGYVDQQKRAERNKDPRSPSPDSHVPDFPTDKQGRPLKDLSKEQGGPIGPN